MPPGKKRQRVQRICSHTYHLPHSSRKQFEKVFCLYLYLLWNAIISGRNSICYPSPLKLQEHGCVCICKKRIQKNVCLDLYCPHRNDYNWNSWKIKNVVVSAICATLIPLGIPRCNCNQRIFPRDWYISRESIRLGIKTCNCNCNLQKMNNHFDDEVICFETTNWFFF